MASINPQFVLPLSLQALFSISAIFLGGKMSGGAISSCKHRHHPSTGWVTFPGQIRVAETSSILPARLKTHLFKKYFTWPSMNSCPHSYKPTSHRLEYPLILEWQKSRKNFFFFFFSPAASSTAFTRCFKVPSTIKLLQGSYRTHLEIIQHDLE